MKLGPNEIATLRQLIGRRYSINEHVSWTLAQYAESRKSSPRLIGRSDEAAIGEDLCTVLNAVPELLNIAERGVDVTLTPRLRHAYASLTPEKLDQLRELLADDEAWSGTGGAGYAMLHGFRASLFDLLNLATATLTDYVPSLAFFNEPDRVEFVTRDCLTVSRQSVEHPAVSEICDMQTGEVLGMSVILTAPKTKPENDLCRRLADAQREAHARGQYGLDTLLSEAEVTIRNTIVTNQVEANRSDSRVDAASITISEAQELSEWLDILRMSVPEYDRDNVDACSALIRELVTRRTADQRECRDTVAEVKTAKRDKRATYRRSLCWVSDLDRIGNVLVEGVSAAVVEATRLAKDHPGNTIRVFAEITSVRHARLVTNEEEASKATRMYPGIWRCALEIAYANGGVNRNRQEAQLAKEFDRWIANQPQEPLAAIDIWLYGLSEPDLRTVSDGERSEADALLNSAPPLTGELLNRYFNEVC